jgi:hypothetical protein
MIVVGRLIGRLGTRVGYASGDGFPESCFHGSRRNEFCRDVCRRARSTGDPSRQFVESMRAHETLAQLPNGAASSLGLACRPVRIGETTWSKRRRFLISSL